jgi:hypothetical protein
MSVVWEPPARVSVSVAPTVQRRSLHGMRTVLSLSAAHREPRCRKPIVNHRQATPHKNLARRGLTSGDVSGKRLWPRRQGIRLKWNLNDRIVVNAKPLNEPRQMRVIIRSDLASAKARCGSTTQTRWQAQQPIECGAHAAHSWMNEICPKKLISCRRINRDRHGEEGKFVCRYFRRTVAYQ